MFRPRRQRLLWSDLIILEKNAVTKGYILFLIFQISKTEQFYHQRSYERDDCSSKSLKDKATQLYPFNPLSSTCE